MENALVGRSVSCNGVIDRFGIVNTLFTGATEPQHDGAKYGGRIYCPVLQPYADGSHRATITEDGNLNVLNSEGIVVMTIPGAKCKRISLMATCRVLPSGYVVSLDPTHDDRAKDLEEAAAGREPQQCDNRRFARVSPNLVGTEVLQLKLDTDRLIIFKLTGEPIPSFIEQPLSFERWGRAVPADSL